MTPDSTSDACFHFGRCELRPAARLLIVQGSPRPVQRRVFDLLAHLVRHAGRVVSRDELLEQVWQRRFVCESVVAKAILKARRTIDGPGAVESIVSARGIGYRFAAVVRVVPSVAPAIAPLPDVIGELQRRGLRAADEHRLEIARAYLEVCLDLEPALPTSALPLARRLWQGTG